MKPTPPVPPRQAAAKFCSDCGEPLPKAAQFCPSCGNAHQPPETSPPPPEVSDTAGGQGESVGHQTVPPAEAAPMESAMRPPRRKPQEQTGLDDTDASSLSVPAPAHCMPTTSVPAMTEVESQTCACGRKLEPDAKFCSGCGNTVGDNQAPTLWLTFRGPQDQPCSVPITGEPITIGKSANCSVTIEGDEYLSREHVSVHRDGERLVVEDLGSSNGTLLKLRGATNLQPGDEIFIGSTMLRIEQRQS